MDVVYPLRCSGWGNEEIKYSVRSLFKHSTEPIDKIFIIGDKPSFFEYNDRLIHIPFRERHVKEVNIWEKVLKASQRGDVSEEFFFCNDDYFMIEDFQMSEFPHYHKGDGYSFNWMQLPIGSLSGYQKKAAVTFKLLKRLKFSTWHFDIHLPNRYEKSKFIKAYEYFKPHLYRGNGLIISTCYGNFNKLLPTFKEDCKVTSIKSYIDSDEKSVAFSTHDVTCGPELKAYLEQLYPDKSPVEK